MTRAVLVFGGTFDPVHVGHIAVALQAREQTRAGAVWLIPARVPAMRPAPTASYASRLELLRRAIAGLDGFEALDVERGRRGASYTVDTMRDLHAAHAGGELRVLLGADAARSIDSWHESAALLEHESFVIVNRAGTDAFTAADAAALGYAHERTTVLEITSPDVSASEVRRRARAGESVDGLVPGSVVDAVAAAYGARPSVHNASG